jgi:hypothetical protein
MAALAAVGEARPAVAAAPPRVDQAYRITATLDVASARLDAVVEIRITNRTASTLDHLDLSVVPRALGYLSMAGPVTVDGATVETSWTTSIDLRVPLPGLEPRDTARVEIPFVLQVGRSPDAFSARTSAEHGVLSFGQWFPIVSSPHDVYGIGDPQITATADRIALELTTTAPMPRDAVACPGLTQAPEVAGTRWRCVTTDVRDFSFVVNPRFSLTRRAAGETDVRVYTETVDGSRTADLAADALTRLGERFGPYPWDDLVLAEVGAGGGFSMEYPRMIHLTRGKVADPYVVYHEVAHQWWYGQVGNDQQEEPWLDEGFADFSARMLLGIGENQCSTRPIDSSVFAWPADATTGGDWTSCDGYFHAVFYRTSEFLTAVRGAMGDDAFFGALRDWIERHRYGFVNGSSLLRHLQSRTDADLRPLIRAYLAEPPPDRSAASRHRWTPR